MSNAREENMKDIRIITFIGLFIGIVGTSFGGLLSTFIKVSSDKLISILFGITGGFMLSIVTFQLLPESYKLGGIWTELLGIILGILLVIFVEEIIPKKDLNSWFKSGIILGISIGLHNFPEGLAIGSAFMAKNKLGLTLSIAMILHNLPEGLAMSLPLRLSKVSNYKILLLTIFAGVPTGVGAFLGAYLGSISDLYISICLSFAGGTMLYIVCNDLIPSANTLQKGRFSTIGIIIGFILGLVIQ